MTKEIYYGKADNQNLRDLKIWQKSIEMVTAIYKLTSHFPDRELFGITTQIQQIIHINTKQYCRR